MLCKNACDNFIWHLSHVKTEHNAVVYNQCTHFFRFHFVLFQVFVSFCLLFVILLLYCRCCRFQIRINFTHFEFHPTNNINKGNHQFKSCLRCPDLHDATVHSHIHTICICMLNTYGGNCGICDILHELVQSFWKICIYRKCSIVAAMAAIFKLALVLPVKSRVEYKYIVYIESCHRMARLYTLTFVVAHARLPTIRIMLK